MSVTVRRASVEDLDALTGFLAAHWRSDHVFVRRPSLLAWQHQEGEGVNVVLAEDDGEVVGFLGYIPLRRFDATLTRHAVALAVWKVVRGRGAPALGLRLLNHLERTVRPEVIFAVGLSPGVVPLYRAMRYETGVFDHHVLPSPSAGSFRIAPGLAGLPRPRLGTGSEVLAEWAAGDGGLDRVEATARGNHPEKSALYLRRRYLEHPEYRYRIVALGTSLDTATLVVLRRVTARGAAALRVVDVVGPTGPLAGSGAALAGLMEREGCEYVDVQHHGLDGEHLTRAGFVDRRSVPGLVVPGYFEPFEERNVDLDYACRFLTGPGAPGGRIRLLRGDADQDRPNT